MFVLLWVTAPALAQDSEPELQPLPEEVSAGFDQTLADIAILKDDIDALDERVAQSDGLIAEVLAKRRDKLWTSMFQGTIGLARAVMLQKDDGKDVSAYWRQLANDLSDLPDEVYGTLERIRTRVVFPSPDMPPEEFVVTDQKLFSTMREVDNLFRELVIYTQIADDFGGIFSKMIWRFFTITPLRQTSAVAPTQVTKRVPASSTRSQTCSTRI